MGNTVRTVQTLSHQYQNKKKESGLKRRRIQEQEQRGLKGCYLLKATKVKDNTEAWIGNAKKRGMHCKKGHILNEKKGYDFGRYHLKTKAGKKVRSNSNHSGICIA